MVNKHLKNRKNEMLLIITNEDYSLTANNNNNSYYFKLNDLIVGTSIPDILKLVKC